MTNGTGTPRAAGTRTARALTLCAVLLMGWIVVLAVTMPSGDYVVRRWSLAWIGLDVAQVAGLLATAVLARRQHPMLPAAAAGAGTLFLVDAWFDTVTARVGLDYAQALLIAWLAELPLGILLWAAAWRAARRAGGRSRAGEERAAERP
ncbi:hypothetical protein AB0I49_03140 [Streptomyces sp. NPDC050617]|uniref:hypothetical protein n=1 Tax=Streptomyces sp. NPDC050617 TaxID=3154628 RepID=UPI003433D06E